MAGTEVIYRMTFDDYVENECSVLIKQDGYAGAETEVKGGTTPVVIRMMAEGDSKFTHIKATEAVIQLISTTSLQYLSLFTSPNKTYYVEVFCGIKRVWVGWINPEYYTEPFMSPPYPITITATDGIALLKNIEFPLPTDFKNTVIYYIANCLKQIGNPVRPPIKVSLGLSATTAADGIVTARLLEKLFIDHRAFRDGHEAWTCYDILSEILASLNARLFFWNDAWHIERIDQKYAAYDVENYDEDGLYTSTTSNYDAVVALTAHTGIATDIRFINTPAMLEVQPAYKGFKVSQDFGSRKNILPFTNYEGKFNSEDFTGFNTLRYWENNSGSEQAILERVEANRNPGDCILKMKGINYTLGQVPAFTAYIEPDETGTPASSYIWTYNEGGQNESALVDWLLGKGSIKLKWRAYAVYENWDSAQPLKAFIKLLLNVDGTIYEPWFDIGNSTEYEWVEQPNTGTKDLDHMSISLPYGEWYEAETVFEAPTALAGGFYSYVGLKILISSPNLSAASLSLDDGILWDDIQLYFYNAADESTDRYYDADIDDDNLLEPEEYQIKFGDTLTPYTTKPSTSDGCGLVNKYVFFDSSGQAVNKFGNGTVHDLSLYSQILYNDLNLTYRQPLFKLRGTLIDTTTPVLDFRTILKDYNNRYYFATGLAYDVKECTYEGEWLQMYDDSGSGGEFNDDFSNDFWI